MWTEERKEKLRKLCVEGKHTAEQIATELRGVTRNAVLGKLHRMGLSLRLMGASAADKAQKRARRAGNLAFASKSPDVQKAIAKAGGRDAWIAKHMERPTAQIAATPLPPDPPIIAKKTFAELQPGDCKFPIGDPRKPDFGFCAEPRVPGQPYCLRCCRIAFAPPRPRIVRPSPAPGFGKAAFKNVEEFLA